MIGWIGTTLQVIGAIALASHHIEPYWAYVIMTPGASIWFIIAGISRNWSLAALQGTFIIINLCGIWNWAA